MALLNLTLGQLLAIFLPAAAAVVALYFYDRSRRRQIVSTLRFFARVAQAPVFTRRKKIQQPWSLAMQLACLALLLAAIAEPELGGRGETGRDHVLILEASAWMNAAAPGADGATLMRAAQGAALDYLRAVPASDRVLLVRADGLATPLTGFTRNRRELERAIRATQPASTGLELSPALELARAAQRLASTRPGEVAVIGSGRASPADLERAAGADASTLRTILLGAEPDNCGIRKLSARRSAADPLAWDIEVGLYNYGTVARRVALALTLGGTRLAARTLTLGPRAAGEAAFETRSAAGGALEAAIDSRDDFRADNRAAIELPRLAPLRVEVFTERPALWQALLTSTRFVDPQFRRPAEYAAPGAAGRLVILDGFVPAAAPEADAVWIAPPATLARQRILLRRWSATHPLAAGLHNRDLRLDRAAVLGTAAGETAIAESDEGPLVVASTAGARRSVRFGFHPLEGGAENQLAIPLLFANLVRWLSPELFRAVEVRASAPGLVELGVPAGTRREQIELDSRQMPGLPFTLLDDRLRFFAGRAGEVRVTAPGREWVYSLDLPEVGEARWTPPAGARRGVPPPSIATHVPPELWPWLALAAAIGLLAEWMLFGRRPGVAAPSAPRSLETLDLDREPERESVAASEARS